jgi:hypothetical protein
MSKLTTIRPGQRAKTRGGQALYWIAERLLADPDGDSMEAGLAVRSHPAGWHGYRAPVFDRFVRCGECLGTGMHRTLPSWCGRCGGTGTVDLDDPDLDDLDEPYGHRESDAAARQRERNRGGRR